MNGCKSGWSVAGIVLLFAVTLFLLLFSIVAISSNCERVSQDCFVFPESGEFCFDSSVDISYKDNPAFEGVKVVRKLSCRGE